MGAGIHTRPLQYTCHPPGIPPPLYLPPHGPGARHTYRTPEGTWDEAYPPPEGTWGQACAQTLVKTLPPALRWQAVKINTLEDSI